MRSISLVFATLLFSSTFAIAYSSPDGEDPFLSEEISILGDVKNPEPIPEPEEDKCSPGQQAMSYSSWVESGYYY